MSSARTLPALHASYRSYIIASQGKKKKKKKSSLSTKSALRRGTDERCGVRSGGLQVAAGKRKRAAVLHLSPRPSLSRLTQGGGG